MLNSSFILLGNAAAQRGCLNCSYNIFKSVQLNIYLARINEIGCISHKQNIKFCLAIKQQQRC